MFKNYATTEDDGRPTSRQNKYKFGITRLNAEYYVIDMRILSRQVVRHLSFLC